MSDVILLDRLLFKLDGGKDDAYFSGISGVSIFCCCYFFESD